MEIRQKWKAVNAIPSQVNAIAGIAVAALLLAFVAIAMSLYGRSNHGN